MTIKIPTPYKRLFISDGDYFVAECEMATLKIKLEKPKNRWTIKHIEEDKVTLTDEV